MIRRLGIQELATQKELYIESTSIGVRFFITNDAMDTREHIALNYEEMKQVIALLVPRCEELRKEQIEWTQSEEGRLHKMEHLLHSCRDFMRDPTIAGDEYTAISIYAKNLCTLVDEFLRTDE